MLSPSVSLSFLHFSALKYMINVSSLCFTLSLGSSSFILPNTFSLTRLAERDMQRTHDQVSGPCLSEDPSGLGVFGIPFEQGLPTSHTRNRKAGVDDYEVCDTLSLVV